MLRAFGLVVVLVVCLVPVAGAQVDAGGKTPRLFVPPAKVVKNPRLQSQLTVIADAAQQRGAAAGLQAARDRGLETSQGKVRVIVEGTASVARQAVASQGGSVEATAGALTEALVPAGAVTALARTAGVDFVRAPFAFSLLGTESQGVAAAAANAWHTAGATGAGAKVAVVDGGFAGLAGRQASGDLPIGLTSVDHCGGSMGAPEVHGTAVAEIVHEMAPSAELTLICVDSEVDLANALTYAKANGITIVNHSVGWYNTARGDGTGAAGTPDAIVADARANGILWVNAAGNSAQKHWSGTFADANGDGLHEYAPGDVTNSIVLFQNEQVCGFLKWDAWPATNQDFDFYLGRDSDVAIVAGSANDQTSSPEMPTEGFCYTNTGVAQTFSFLIDRYSATTAPRLDIFVTIGDALEHGTVEGSVIEPATAPGALAVGAICWQNDSLEPFSSRGPTIDGRTKPDIVGSSSVSSGIYGSFAACGTSGFAGTSSAAPHVAGAAALLKAMFPLASVSELQAWLESDALDLAPAGKDASTGAGKLRLPTSPPTVTTSAPSSALTTYESFEVSGNVSPRGLTTSYHWEYGPTTSYGTQTAPVTLASPRTGQQVGTTLSGLAADTEHHFRLVATNLFGTSVGEDRTQRTAPALPPDVVTQVPQEVGAHAGRLDSSVTPNTAATTARFEWGTTTAYGNLTPVQNAGVFGTSDIVAELADLDPDTEYHYRIVATNIHGTTNGGDLSFTTTGSGLPVGVTGAAAVEDSTRARVEAEITPNGLPTTYLFEYALSPATSPLQQTATGQAGYGTTARQVSTVLTGLQPGTQYGYRIVATNSLGTSTGGFATFTTAAAPAPPSGGGGGGGGGGGSADLGIEGWAQPVAAAMGEELTFHLRVTDVNVAVAFGVKIDVELPAGVQLVGSYADRGPGCAGAPLVCDLDFLSSVAPVGTIMLRTKVNAPGELALKATVRYVSADPKPENNTVTIVANRAVAPTPKTPSTPKTIVPTTKTGNARANTLRGSARPDTLRGLGGNDRLYGLAGNDRLFGGSGNDRLFGGTGRDLLDGGTGNDVISARDRARDTIRCGRGHDTVTADRIDAVARDCERVTRR